MSDESKEIARLTTENILLREQVILLTGRLDWANEQMALIAEDLRETLGAIIEENDAREAEQDR